MVRRSAYTIVALLALVVSFSVGTQAYLAPLDLRTMVKEAKVVALVEVTAKSWHPKEKYHRQQATLKILHAFKGAKQGAELTVSFGRDFTCGGTSYKPGQFWLVFLDRDGGSKIYGTCNYQYGQMVPWEALLSRVQQIVSPGSKAPPATVAGSRGVKSADLLTAAQWSKLRFGGVGLRMTRAQVQRVPADSRAEAHFDLSGRVDMVEGTTLWCDGQILMRSLNEQEATSRLGRPRETIGAWKLYGSSSAYLAVEFYRERISGFILACGEEALRNRVSSLSKRARRKGEQGVVPRLLDPRGSEPQAWPTY